MVIRWGFGESSIAVRPSSPKSDWGGRGWADFVDASLAGSLPLSDRAASLVRFPKIEGIVRGVGRQSLCNLDDRDGRSEVLPVPELCYPRRAPISK
jgi:hypothetical protein